MTRDELIDRYKTDLNKYLPPQTLHTIAEWILYFKFNLKITQSRNSKLGDYSSPQRKGYHLITINHNLNQYAFLITLVHEVAHLVTYEQFKEKLRNIKPHGAEWKKNFKNLIGYFLNNEIFPVEVLHALKNYMDNPAASSCSDADLQRVLKRYDPPTNKKFLEDLAYNSTFKINGRIFKKGQLQRKRFECIELATKKTYLVSGIAEVLPISETIF